MLVLTCDSSYCPGRLAHWIVFEAHPGPITAPEPMPGPVPEPWPYLMPVLGGRSDLVDVQNWITARQRGAALLRLPEEATEAAPAEFLHHELTAKLDKEMRHHVLVKLRRAQQKARKRELLKKKRLAGFAHLQALFSEKKRR